MSRVETAGGLDRLPWLPDDPRPRARRLGIAGPAALLAAAVSIVAFWIGTNGFHQTAGIAPPARPATTVRLPAPQAHSPAQPEVKLGPAPEVEPIVAPPMPVIDSLPPVRRAPEKRVPATTAVGETSPPENVSSKPADAAPLQPWPVRQVDGAAGRLVRIGAFGTAHQAKRGWWAIVRMNPTLKRLPALVVPVRSLRNGKVYYRLQMGTTSQAHSTVLCQRMRMVGQSCIVIGELAQK